MFRKLGKYVRQYKKFAIATPVLVIGEVLMEVLIPLVMSYLIDEIEGAGRISAVCICGVIIIAMGTLSLGSGAYAGKTAAIASTGFAANVRQGMYYRIQEYSFANLDRFSTASLVTRLTTDVTNVQSAFQMLIRMTVRAPIMLVFALVMSLSINWRLATIFLGIAPLIAVAFYFIMRKAFPYFDTMFAKYDKLNAVTQENLTAIRVVKSYVREEYEIAKFAKASADVRDFSKKASKLLILSTPIMCVAVYGCMLLIYGLGGNWIMNGAYGMTPGVMTAFLSYSMMILMSLMMVAMVIVMLTMARASAKRIVEVLDEQSELHDPENPLTEIPDGSVEFENVRFDYNPEQAEEDVLREITLRFAAGSTVGILGGTGSSKTTLVQLIPRLYDATAGTVRVGGHDVRAYSLKALRDQVAMVLQKNVLFSGTIEENLRWGNPDATQEEIDAACRRAQAYDFIQSFPQGYQTDLGQGGVNVSGGQKQRLCIARALLKHPKILILDDSTSAVDTKTDAQIRKALREDLGDVTKIIIAQRVASVEDADQIVVLNDGVVSAVGTHAELLERSEIYREVYSSQTKGRAEEPVGGGEIHA